MDFSEFRLLQCPFEINKNNKSHLHTLSVSKWKRKHNLQHILSRVCRFPVWSLEKQIEIPRESLDGAKAFLHKYPERERDWPRSHTAALASLELTLQPRLASNSQWLSWMLGIQVCASVLEPWLEQIWQISAKNTEAERLCCLSAVCLRRGCVRSESLIDRYSVVPFQMPGDQVWNAHLQLRMCPATFQPGTVLGLCGRACRRCSRWGPGAWTAGTEELFPAGDKKRGPKLKAPPERRQERGLGLNRFVGLRQGGVQGAGWWQVRWESS